MAELAIAAQLSPPRAAAWQRVITLLGIGVTVALGIASIPSLGASDTFTQLQVVAAIVASISLATSGAVLVLRLPSHPVGWLLWSSGCLFALAGDGSAVAGMFVAADPGLAAWIVLLCGACWVPAIVAVAVLLPLVFPTGSLPSTRWRAVVAIGVVSAAFSAVQDLFTPFPPGVLAPGITNPLGTTGTLADFVGLLGVLSSVAGVVCLPLVATSLILRARRASGVERAQMKWLAAAVAIVGPALALGIVLQAIPGDLALFVGNLAFVAMFIGLALLPVAIGIAILRYRLYDIDVIIKRTVVYVPLTAILAGVFAATTVLLQRAFIAVTGERSDAAVVASTLILATLFTPIKNALQAFVDQRFRDQVDARRRLEGYVDRIATAEWQPDPARTLRGFLAVAVGALDTDGGRALLDDGGAFRTVATIGGPFEPGAVADVEAVGRRIGRIELAPRTAGRTYRPGETALLGAAARDLAAAIAGDVSSEPKPVIEGVAPASSDADLELSRDATSG